MTREVWRSPATALWILAVLAAVFSLKFAAELLIPIVIAVLISYALEPVVAWLVTHHVPRLAGASLILALIASLSGLGIYSLQDDFLQATEALPKAARRLRVLLTPDAASVPASNIQQAVEELSGNGTGESHGTAGTRRTPELPPNGSSSGTNAIGSVFSVAGHLTVIFFLVFFLLVAGDHFRTRIIEIAGPTPERRALTAKIIDDINGQIQRYLLALLVTGAVVGIATWAILVWMEVPQPVVWGLLAGLFNSIPYFGPLIVSGGLFVVGFVNSGDGLEALKIAGAALAITSLEGWLLTPPLMGRFEHMSALVVFVGLLLWTWIWGPWGTVLAVPMLAVVKAVVDHVEALKPVSRLMAP